MKSELVFGGLLLATLIGCGGSPPPTDYHGEAQEAHESHQITSPSDFVANEVDWNHRATMYQSRDGSESDDCKTNVTDAAMLANGQLVSHASTVEVWHELYGDLIDDKLLEPGAADQDQIVVCFYWESDDGQEMQTGLTTPQEILIERTSPPNDKVDWWTTMVIFAEYDNPPSAVD